MLEETSDIPVVILAGGLGTRLREETEFKPKPMLEIGERPIIWHIMKHYSRYGYKKFIICLGYKGDVILNYFRNYQAHGTTTIVRLEEDRITTQFSGQSSENWNVLLCDTGKDSLTGDRLIQIAHHVDAPYFLMTYGDGLSNVAINRLVEFHLKNEALATLTAVHPANRFGALDISESGMVTNFLEKPRSQDWINAGFFVLDKSVFEEIQAGSFEDNTLTRLALNNKLSAYKHDGYWQCMDTYREYLELNKLWSEGNPPWLTEI